MTFRNLATESHQIYKIEIVPIIIIKKLSAYNIRFINTNSYNN